jgi:hypothetical protein
MSKTTNSNEATIETESTDPATALVEEAPKKTRAIRNHVVKNPMEAEAYFGKQYTKTKDLPDPSPSLQAIATGVIEVIAGTRQVEQLSRFLSDDVYQRLAKRSLEAQAARKEKAAGNPDARPVMRPNFMVKTIHNTSPCDGVIESVVLINGSKRTRAISIRLEGINSRWRATVVNVI